MSGAVPNIFPAWSRGTSAVLAVVLPLLLFVGALFPPFLLLFLILVGARVVPARSFSRSERDPFRRSGLRLTSSGPRSPPL